MHEMPRCTEATVRTQLLCWERKPRTSDRPTDLEELGGVVSITLTERLL